MALQQDIAFDIAESKVGQRLRVIVDEATAGGYIGRTEYDSPEVDCCVYLPAEPRLEIGAVYDVDITGSEDFDLLGVVAAS